MILIRGGFEGFYANHWIVTRDGYRYRADFAFPRRKVLIEYQSEMFHQTEKDRSDDRTRRSRLEAEGWTVIEIGKDDLKDPDELIRRIRRVLDRHPEI